MTSLKQTIESLYCDIENDLLRNFLLNNSYATAIDVEDQENKNLVVGLIFTSTAETVNGVEEEKFTVIEIDRCYMYNQGLEKDYDLYYKNEAVRKHYMRLIEGVITDGHLKNVFIESTSGKK